MATTKNAVQKILEEAGKFVTAHGGVWGHQDWEAFLAQIEKQGFVLNDELKRHVGNILEASKGLFHVMPQPAAKKKVVKKAAAKKST